MQDSFLRQLLYLHDYVKDSIVAGKRAVNDGTRILRRD
jgi:hypothetical protein